MEPPKSGHWPAANGVKPFKASSVALEFAAKTLSRVGKPNAFIATLSQWHTASDYPARPSTRNAYALSGSRQNLFLVLRATKTHRQSLGELGLSHAFYPNAKKPSVTARLKLWQINYRLLPILLDTRGAQTS